MSAQGIYQHFQQAYDNMLPPENVWRDFEPTQEMLARRGKEIRSYWEREDAPKVAEILAEDVVWALDALIADAVSRRDALSLGRLLLDAYETKVTEQAEQVAEGEVHGEYSNIPGSFPWPFLTEDCARGYN